MKKQQSNKKIFFQQQEVESTLLCAREVMDITACFLCSLVKHQSNHDQQNIIYSLALSYAQLEQQINKDLTTHFDINLFKQPEQTTHNLIVDELKIKLKAFNKMLVENQKHDNGVFLVKKLE
ncbi:hypothetical protein [Aliikangiella sp. IMCC44359]|uniref:hypothetical protein n=1 Tax=Aliikangiella sp. IMCC44359 TaxID=3459125 RepID=UPI00403B1A8D